MKTRTAVLAIAPVYRGLGFVVLDHEATLLDWGTMDTRKFNPAACLTRTRYLLTTFTPKRVVLELTGAPSCRRKQHVRDLISDMALLASDLGFILAFYDRSAVIRSLKLDHGATKDVIARAIADQLPPIAHRLPAPRRIWESEKHSMAMFAAAGLALAHLSSNDRHSNKN